MYLEERSERGEKKRGKEQGAPQADAEASESANSLVELALILSERFIVVPPLFSYGELAPGLSYITLHSVVSAP